MDENKKSLPVVEVDREEIAPLNLKNSPYLIPAAIVIAGAFIAGGLFFGLKGGFISQQPEQNGVVARIESNAKDEVTLGTNPVQGNPEAKLLIVEFSDFQCPFCGRFFAQTEPQIIEKYVKTGVARFAYRDFAFLDGFVGQERGESHLAAEAARCAADQGKFWEYHSKLFLNQNGENEGAFSQENLMRFASELSLNASQFETCLQDGKYREAVISDTQDGSRLGVNATPTVFVGYEKIIIDPQYIQARVQAGERIIPMDSGSVAIVGALPYASIEPIIEAVLDRVK